MRREKWLDFIVSCNQANEIEPLRCIAIKALCGCVCFILLFLTHHSHLTNKIRLFVFFWQFFFDFIWCMYTKLYPLFAVDDQRSFDSYSFISFSWFRLVVLRLFIFMLKASMWKHKEEKIRPCLPPFCLWHFRENKISTLSNKSTNETVIVSQMNQILAICSSHWLCMCVRKHFYTLCAQSVCLLPKITLAIVYHGLKWLKCTKPTEILPLIHFKWCN